LIIWYRLVSGVLKKRNFWHNRGKCFFYRALMPLFIGHSKNTKSEHLLSGILKKPGPSHPGYIVNSIHVSKERNPNEAYKTAMAIFFGK
jgi:hypothetical protein